MDKTLISTYMIIIGFALIGSLAIGELSMAKTTLENSTSGGLIASAKDITTIFAESTAGIASVIVIVGALLNLLDGLRWKRKYRVPRTPSVIHIKD